MNADLLNAQMTNRNEIVINFATGAVLKTANPAVIIALKILAEQNGKPIATKDLLNKACAIFGQSINHEVAKNAILEQFLRLVLADAVGIYSDGGKYLSQVSEKPTASLLARMQAKKNDWITNQRSEKNNIDLFNRILLQYLDGSNDFNAIFEKMAKHVENDELTLSIDGKKISDTKQIRELIADVTKENILNLARNALLVA